MADRRGAPWSRWSLRRKGVALLTLPMLLFTVVAALQAMEGGLGSEFDDDWHHEVSFALLVLGMVLCITALAVFVRLIDRRLGALRRDALLLARGESLPPQPPGGDEIAELGRALARAGELLRERELELRDATWAAERANESKTEFLSRMSHELRTPLNAMLGFAQLLAFEPLSHDQHEDVEQIIGGGRHLLELINEVLDISRIEAGLLDLDLDAVPVHAAVADCLALLLPTASARSIQVIDETVGPATAGIHVRADRQRLAQILLNLVSNAIKYNRVGGTVTVTCSVDERTVRISVVDTGPGVATEDLELVFAPFERLGAERTEIEGTGIGLALSRQLTTAMGGTLSVSSSLGRGTTFWLELPLASVDLEVGPPSRSGGVPADPGAPAADHGRPWQVLCIDDNDANARVVEMAISRLGTCEVHCVARAAAGLDHIARHRPDVLLLDLHLPDLTGYEVLSMLRADAATADLPVVVISADATKASKERVSALGAEAYLTKPIDVRLLIDWVERLTARASHR